jgi:hypothetical protein
MATCTVTEEASIHVSQIFLKQNIHHQFIGKDFGLFLTYLQRFSP